MFQTFVCIFCHEWTGLVGARRWLLWVLWWCWGWSVLRRTVAGKALAMLVLIVLGPQAEYHGQGFNTRKAALPMRIGSGMTLWSSWLLLQFRVQNIILQHDTLPWYLQEIHQRWCPTSGFKLPWETFSELCPALLLWLFWNGWWWPGSVWWEEAWE